MADTSESTGASTRAGKASAPRPAITFKSTVLLCVKFMILVPVCLVVWLILLPYYTSLVGTSSAFFLKHFFSIPIQETVVRNESELRQGQAPVAPTAEDQSGAAMRFLKFLVAKTQTALTFKLENGHEPTMTDVGHLMANVAPFIALVLASSGLGLWRRARIMVIGVFIIYASHVITIILRFIAGRTPLPTAIGFISIMLPFLLWIVLAYWDQLSAFFLDAPAPRPAPPADRPQA